MGRVLGEQGRFVDIAVNIEWDRAWHLFCSLPRSIISISRRLRVRCLRDLSSTWGPLITFQVAAEHEGGWEVGIVGPLRPVCHAPPLRWHSPLAVSTPEGTGRATHTYNISRTCWFLPRNPNPWRRLRWAYGGRRVCVGLWPDAWLCVGGLCAFKRCEQWNISTWRRV